MYLLPVSPLFFRNAQIIIYKIEGIQGEASYQKSYLRILHDIKCDSQMAGIVSDCDGRSPIAWQDLREISG